MEADALLTTQQTAERLGIDRTAVIRRVQAGTLRSALKLPGRTGAHLFRAGDVEAAARGESPPEDPDEHHPAPPAPRAHAIPA